MAEMLDISILSADKYFESELVSNKEQHPKLNMLFEKEVLIEQKTDGVKLTVIYTGEESRPFIFAYKGTVINQDEFIYAPKVHIKAHSIGSSQFQIILDHFNKLCTESVLQSLSTILKPNTELFIEYLMKKPTLSSNYKKTHGMVLIAYSKTVFKEKLGRLVSNPIEFNTSKRDELAKLLKLNVPNVLFNGILGSEKMFIGGILNNELKDLFNKSKNSFNFSNYRILYNQIKDLFLSVPSQFGGVEEGVVLKFNNGVILKFQQSYQTDQNARAEIKNKFRNSEEEEIAYWNNIRLVALNIISNIEIGKRQLNDILRDFALALKNYKLDLPVHSKKVKINILDDIATTAKNIIIKKLKGNNNALFLGKFRILTKAHFNIIKNAILSYDGLTIAIVTSAENKSTRDLRERMIRAAIDSLKRSGLISINKNIEFMHVQNGSLFTIINRAPMNINIILAGSDRVSGYRQQLKTAPDISVREISRKDEDVSATKVVQALQMNDIVSFKEYTPDFIHNFYNELKEIYATNVTNATNTTKE